MAGGGKGGSSTTSVEVPEWMESAAKSNLARAADVSQIGYVPYYGPDVAAMTPMQQAAAQNVAGAASAFGMQTPTGAGVTGMPQAQEFAGGIRGYSSAPLFEQSLETFGEKRPGQKAAIDDLFINPTSGKGGGTLGSMLGEIADNAPGFREPVAPTQTAADREGPSIVNRQVRGPTSPTSAIPRSTQVSGPEFSSGSRARSAPPPKPKSSSGGYTSIKDMFDGGGPGASGDKFGGALGGITNKLTGRG